MQIGQRIPNGNGKATPRRKPKVNRSAMAVNGIPGPGGQEAQLKKLLQAMRAAQRGDFAARLSARGSGLLRELAEAFNALAAANEALKSEMVRVERVVGREGRMAERATLDDPKGGWAISIGAINALIGDLVQPTTEVARVISAVAAGDLTQKMALEIKGQPVKGEFLRIGTTVNSMVDQLNAFASEVTRVAREVGTDGKLGGQATVRGVSGVWKDLTDNVNFMASNLTTQVRGIVRVVTAVAKGDLSQKITVDVKGEILELKNTINTMVDQLNSFASEVTRMAREVGTEGELGGQADVRGVSGVWKDLTDSVNFMARNLTAQVRGIVKVVTAVANGDLTQKLSVDAKGEVAALAETINSMTHTLGTFAEQVSTVAREVGVEGLLGGQARAPGVAGTWKDLTDNVNFMASNLTTQVRGIVKVVTAVANGDLSQKLVGVEAKGEIAALAETINNMCDTLGIFADQVSTVAREVGIEGKLGGQAKVPGAAGTWKDLTDNVNQLAGNLTNQVRAISSVATAVTKGDLTRSVQVEAQGEVAALKDNINQMIINLRETTQKSTEQDWLKTNLAKFSGMMQSQKNLQTVSRLIMSELTPLVGAQHGAFFMMDAESGTPVLKLVSSYAYRERKNLSNRFRLGESLVGQCALEKKPILLTKVPPDYIQIGSGLGEGTPLNILVLPVLFEGEVKAVIELASFYPFSAIHQLFLDQVRESIGVVLNMISANTRTEQLLLQSQGLTQELQSQSKELTEQQQELKRTNAALEKQALELEEKAKLLEEQNRKVEIKNKEVEQARVALEEKAEQLSLISKYKSEFLANMSHELRTPLNSLLILAKLLAENEQGNLSDKQVEYAKTIYGSGGDLLTLINEILDLSKVEAGKMEVQTREVVLSELRDFAERQFRPIAQHNGVEFEIAFAPDLPSAIRSDPQRLQQILKNLLGNAFKFTQTGAVRLKASLASRSFRFSSEALNQAERVIAFAVEDTGIGIAKDKQRIIFEAFQQADGTTSRQYGGTGLGLSISREFARLLGGEIAVESELGKGSVFTLFLPDRFVSTDESLARAGPENARSPKAPEVVWQYEALSSRPVDDDRASIAATDRVLLIVEDDSKFARILLGVAREKGFKGVVASRGDTALFLAEKLQPTAITLDIRLPVVDGWSVLKRLKSNPRTRHIPVHVISIVERTNRGAAMGAFAYLEKPVSREAIQFALSEIGSFSDRTPKELLLVEDDSTQRSTIAELIQGEDVRVTAVRSAEEALSALQSSKFDCVVVDLVLPGLDGFRLIDSIKAQARFSDLPIIVYTSKDLSHDEQRQLQKGAVSVIVKSSAQSAEHLLNDASLFLHRVDKRAPLAPRVSDEDASADGLLAGKKVLVVDDDVRNLFAIISALESHNAEVIFAETGSAALELLRKNPDVDAVLMDLMMPGMDGFETMREIRHQARYESLPIIAVTAKALKDDYDKCVQAGASDYLPKPVDPDRLVEMIRLWTRV